MKKLIFTCLLVLPAVGFSKINTENCGSYGPDANNLTVLVDDEGSNNVLRIGHEVMGTFFELRLEGCKSMGFDSNKKLYCDDRIVGAVGTIQLATDDLGYNGPRAEAKLDEHAYLLYGSCRPADHKPLTIRF